MYYDVNNVIYGLLNRYTTTEELFYVKLFKDIDIMLKSGRPRHSLFLAVDGPGPRAKVSTQLSRRKKYPFEPGAVLQRAAFTPGTSFMHRMQQALLVYAATRSADSRNRKLAIWVSGSDCPGEGENKCFAHMRTVPAHHRSLIVGNDSDLIAYGLRAHCEVHVMRVGGHASSSSTLVNAKKLREELAKAVGAPPSHESRVADDFLFLSLMNGNDYVPSLVWYDFKSIWQGYKKLKQSKPELKDVFVFDAHSRVVNYDFLTALHDTLGVSEAGRDEEEGPGSGRLHVRQVVAEILAQGGDEPLFEMLATPVLGEAVEVRLSSAKSNGTPWHVHGKGRSQRHAIVDVCFKALAPGSPLFKHLEGNDNYTPEELIKITKLLALLKFKAGEVVNWFERRALVPSGFTFEVGHIPGHPLQPMTVAPKTARPVNEVYMSYVEGLVWSFEMYGGMMKNYGYHYPFIERFSLSKLCKAAPQVSGSWDTRSREVPPLSPIALGLCLLGGPARQLLPAPFGSLAAESDTDVGHIFADGSEALLRDREKLTEYLNQVEQYTAKVAEREKKNLSPDAAHLLSLHHPTCFMDRTNPLLRTFPRKEVDAYLYLPPKMPHTKLPYKGLKDAPPSPRIVAATNVPKTAQGHWFRFGTPYMQVRKFAVFRGLLRK